MKLRVYSEMRLGRRTWTFHVYGPPATAGVRWLSMIGAGRSTWAEAMADGSEILQRLSKAAK